MVDSTVFSIPPPGLSPLALGDERTQEKRRRGADVGTQTDLIMEYQYPRNLKLEEILAGIGADRTANHKEVMAESTAGETLGSRKDNYSFAAKNWGLSAILDIYDSLERPSPNHHKNAMRTIGQDLTATFVVFSRPSVVASLPSFDPAPGAERRKKPVL
ncbi:hypothetical protein L596_007566 [Steinernema carpocapsae]|uniref:Uncharacterized protein n=1 Tax=Steinernema carpocapsae TaxID=34508 RepID=A0A4U5PAC5_STECR|nr:hypothetical protein L596_007566 [Steinernema carpocapsae]